MRVLILNYEYPPLGGGAGIAGRYLMTELSKMENISVDLITSSVGESRSSQLGPRARIHFLDIGKSGSLHYQSQSDLLVYTFRAYAYAKRLMRRECFDVVHAFFGIPCGAAAMRLGLPYIISLRGSDVPFYNRRFEKLDKLLFKRLSTKIWKRAAFVVANSGGLRDLALQSAPTQSIEVIPTGVDTGYFSRKTVVASDDAPFTIVSTGRLIERKGYAYLIEALCGLENVRLKLLGDGNLQENLARAAATARVSVDFMGACSKEQVATALARADLFVLPSLNEGMSNSLLEALASGLPAVVTDVGGSAELVTDNVNGFIVPKANSGALRRAVEVYVRNRRLKELHGPASRRIAEKMSVAENARKYVTLYEAAKGAGR